MYKIKIYRNWPGKTQYFQNVNGEKICGLYINKDDTRPLSELLELLKDEIKQRNLKISM